MDKTMVDKLMYIPNAELIHKLTILKIKKKLLKRLNTQIY